MRRSYQPADEIPELKRRVINPSGDSWGFLRISREISILREIELAGRRAPARLSFPVRDLSLGAPETFMHPLLVKQ